MYVRKHRDNKSSESAEVKQKGANNGIPEENSRQVECGERKRGR